jgi:SET domain
MSSSLGSRMVGSSRCLRTRSNVNVNANGIQRRRQRSRMWTVQQETAVQQAMTVALKRVNRLMAQKDNGNGNDNDNDNAILRQFLEDCANHCQIAPSTLTNAGRGLFATRDVPPGTIITLYPAHFLGLEMEMDAAHNAAHNDNDDDDLYHCRVFSSETDKVYFEQHDYESETGNNLLVLQEDRKPIVPSLPQAILHLDVNPEQPTMPAWLSHIINDGATAVSHREADILDYYRHTNARRNCFHVPLGPSPLMATVTTRAVQEGDEFFTSYDFLYWVMDLVDNQVVTDDHMIITKAMDQEMDAMEDALQEATQSVPHQYRHVVAEIHKLFQQTTLQ